MPSYPLYKIAEIVGGEVVGGGDEVIVGVAGIKEARKGEITFLTILRWS